MVKVILLLSSLAAGVICGPRVTTKYGQIEGFEVNRRDGGKAEVFLAMPYAKPPIGELRFEKPELPEPWEGVYNATSFRDDCVPHVNDPEAWVGKFSEDCLTFNVIRPKHRNKFLPVLFWVHGGGYELGSASMHGYQAFVDNYIPNDIIVVSIQYRLGFLGFFSDGTDEARGNIGLFDEAAALKFVYDNIESFGGDRNEITVWGYSAGAGSVSHFTFSPYTTDHFARAIIMSGSAFANWATGSQVAKHGVAFANAVGCHGPHLKSCLKTKSIDELLQGVESIGSTTDNIDILKFGPVIDGDYLPDHPSQMIDQIPKKPTIMGLARKEGNFFTILRQIPSVNSFGLFPEDLGRINETTVLDTIKHKLLYDNRFGYNNDRAFQKISDYYLQRDRPDEIHGNGFFVDRYTEIFSDISFNVPVLREIARKVKVGTPIWAYMFDYYNDSIFADHIPPEAKGSPHVNEYHYLFEMPVFSSLDLNSGQEKFVRDNFVNIVVSFTKTGKPSASGNVEWTPVTNGDEIDFLRISNNFTMEHGLFSGAAHFWNDLVSEGFDVVDPLNPEILGFFGKEEL